MTGEIIRQFYNGHRILTGDGAIFVLFVAAIIVMLFLAPHPDRRTAPLFLGVHAAIGCALAAFIGAVRERSYPRKASKAAAILFAVCLSFLACAVSGRMVFSRDLSTAASNDLHIPDELVRSMDAMLSDTDAPKVMTMPGWGLYFTAYSSAFSLMYEEGANGDVSSFDEDQMIAYTELTRRSPDMKRIAFAAKRSGCSYVVLSKDMWPERPITKYGYELFFEDGNVCVYREVMSP